MTHNPMKTRNLCAYERMNLWEPKTPNNGDIGYLLISSYIHIFLFYLVFPMDWTPNPISYSRHTAHTPARPVLTLPDGVMRTLNPPSNPI